MNEGSGSTHGRWGKPTLRDVISGFVTGLFSIPEGMAYASIGGFAAPLGLWSGVVPTIIGSVFARTVLMVTTLTSAIALTSASVLSDAGLAPDDVGAIATLTVLTGIVMLVLGLLKLGSVMSFVSTAVMTGFTTGIALQIIAGVVGDSTGYEPTLHNTFGKIVEAFVHIAEWDAATVAVASATVASWVLFRFIRPLRSLATLLALLVVTAVVAILRISVETVADIAEIARSLPPLSLPDVSAVPVLATGAVAIALVALAQAAGISAAVANPDGTRANASKDFVAQGLANIAGGVFSALPTGGSLSRTGVATSAGAMTRWSGVFAGVWLAVIVLAVGPIVGYIPMAVIGGLMLVIGGELIAGRWSDIVLVARTSWLSLAAMVVTFLATTQLPLQQAIFLGAGLSILLTAYSVSRVSRFVELKREPDGGWLLQDPPARLPSGRTTVLHYAGVGFFAEVNRLEEQWPDITGAKDAAIVLSIRESAGVPSATFLKSLSRQIGHFAEAGIPFVMSGIAPDRLALLTRTGVADKIGAENLFPAEDRVMASLDAALARAEVLRASAQKGD